MKNLIPLTNNEMALVKVCADIEYRGILIDRKYVEDSYQLSVKKYEEAREHFKTDTGRTYKDSSVLFAEIFDSRKEVYGRTEKGNPSFTSEILELSKSPTAKLINTIRFHEKRANTYFKNFLYYSDLHNYLHPSANQAGTKTGRFSYSQPNLQNLPKEEEDNLDTNIRRSFVAPKDYFLLAIDYDQMEYKLMLDYAGELDIIEQVRKGMDIHQLVADLVGISRSSAKTLNFALLYGVGLDELALMLDVSREQAAQIKKLYFVKIPKVKVFLDEVRKTARQRCYTFNWFGRRFQCSNINWAYKHSNYIIQGGCADIIKIAMVQIDAFLKHCRSRMVLQIHDELLFYLHKDEFSIIEELQSIMNNVYKPINGLPMTCDWSISETSFSYWDMEESAKFGKKI